MADAPLALRLLPAADVEKLAAPELDVPAWAAVQWVDPAAPLHSALSAAFAELRTPDADQSAGLSPAAKELPQPPAVSPVSLCLPVRPVPLPLA